MKLQRLAKGIFCILPGLLTLTLPGAAQTNNTLEAPLRSSGSLSFYLDACQFAAADGQTRLELSYAVALTTPAAQERITLLIDLQLSVAGQRYADLHEKKYFSVTADSPLTFIDLKPFTLTADTVSLQLTMRDSSSGRSGEIGARLPVQRFGAALSMSDLFFISALQRPDGTADHPFLRHGLIMLPNPARSFDAARAGAKGWFYFEVNQLPANSTTYTLRYSLFDLAGRELLTEERPALPVQQANSSRVEKLDLDRVPPGTWRLELVLTAGGMTASRRGYFTRCGGEPDAAAALPMSEKDQERYLEQLRFIATREEIRLFESLDIPGKQQFILRFWQEKDPTPETPGNEFMVDYFARLAEARQRFRGGLGSDMARIWLRYGEPLQIERQASNTRYNKPVEIWNYAVNGTTQFVFVDRSNDGHWALVHSNHPDEFSNAQWEQELK